MLMGPGPLKWLWVGELLTWEEPLQDCSVPHSPLTYKDTDVKWQVTYRRSGSGWGQYPVPWHPSQGLLLKPYSGWENNDTHSNTSILKLIRHLTNPKITTWLCYNPASVAWETPKINVHSHLVRLRVLRGGVCFTAISPIKICSVCKSTTNVSNWWWSLLNVMSY